jgi:hypothetical protein
VTYSPLTVEQWGGLNLVEDAGEIALASAVDLLNVTFDRRGRLRSRDGYSLFFTSPVNYNLYTGSAFFRISQNPQMVVTDTFPGMRALTNAGATIATQVFGGGSPWAGFARFGTPTNEYLYVGNGTDTLWRWDGAAFSQPAGFAAPVTVNGSLLAVKSPDNRLVVSGLTANPSRVLFSNAGAAETFGANDYVDLTPGDGENVRAVVAWQELVFVFKRTKFFVIYGTSTDSTGSPVFNYRPVLSGVGAQGWAGAVATPEGVYFYAEDGIYLTSGGPPVRVSQPLDPFFRGQTTAFFSKAATNTSVQAVGAVSMAYNNGLLYVRGPFAASGASAVLTYDALTKKWSYWDVSVGSFFVFRTATQAADSVYFNIDNAKTLMYFDTAATTDNGASISSTYRTGFFNARGQTAESTIREVVLDGIGTVAVKGSTNWGSLGSATNVTLGTSPATAQGRYRKAQRARQHSYQFASVSGGAWTLNEATMHVRELRPLGAKSA